MEKMAAGRRLLLHFGAVDQHCRVYVDGMEVARHTGGYLPFTVDVTDYVKAPKVASGMKMVELSVVVKDLSDTSYHARGKQKLGRGGMYYTAQSGIWQTVWMEYVPAHYIEDLDVQTELGAVGRDGSPASGKVRVTVKAAGNIPLEIAVEQAGIYADEQSTDVAVDGVIVDAKKEGAGDVARPRIVATASGTSNQPIEIDIPALRLWNCETPYLYYRENGSRRGAKLFCHAGVFRGAG